MQSITFKNPTKITVGVIRTICDFANRNEIQCYVRKNNEEALYKMNSIISLLFANLKKGQTLHLCCFNDSLETAAKLALLKTEIETLR